MVGAAAVNAYPDAYLAGLATPVVLYVIRHWPGAPRSREYGAYVEGVLSELCTRFGVPREALLVERVDPVALLDPRVDAARVGESLRQRIDPREADRRLTAVRIAEITAELERVPLDPIPLDPGPRAPRLALEIFAEDLPDWRFVAFEGEPGWRHERCAGLGCDGCGFQGFSPVDPGDPMRGYRGPTFGAVARDAVATHLDGCECGGLWVGGVCVRCERLCPCPLCAHARELNRERP